MYGCLLLFHAKVTERIWMKLGTQTDHVLDYHIGYYLFEYIK